MDLGTVAPDEGTTLRQMAILDTVESADLATHDIHGDGLPWCSPGVPPPGQKQVPAPKPEEEAERLSTLHRLHLNHEPNPVLDELTRLAAELCGSNAAGIAIVDQDAVWFKAGFNLAAQSMPRELAICSWTVLSAGSKPLVIRDIAFDRRFSANPFFAEQGIRSYIGAPLVAQNLHKIGCLAAFSSEVIELTPARMNGMQQLAEKVMRELESANWITGQSSLRDEKEMQQLSHNLRSPLHTIVGHAQLLMDTNLTSEQILLTGNILKSAEYLTRVITSVLEARLTGQELAAKAQLESEPWEEIRKLEAERAVAPTDGGEIADSCDNRYPSAGLVNGSSELLPIEIEHVQRTWAMVSGDAQTVSKMLSDNLFDLDPRLRALFPFDTEMQRAKLMHMIQIAVRGLTESEELALKLQKLGRLHSRMGVTPRMYRLLIRALLSTLGARLGEVTWTPAVKAAWKKVLMFMSTEMQDNDPEAINDLREHGSDSLPSRGDAYIESAGVNKETSSGAGSLHPGVRPDYAHFSVLNVDDNSMNLRLLTLMITRLGIGTCDEACNGEECLKLVQQHEYDCIFLDLQMPVMGGTVACLRINQRFGELRRPFMVAITADTTPGVNERCRDAGFDAILRKPTSRRSIQETIDQAVAWKQKKNGMETKKELQATPLTARA